MYKSEEQVHLRFQAVVIASQLPDNRAEALLVLDYARHMVVECTDNPSSGVSDNVQLSFLPPLNPKHRDSACRDGRFDVGPR
jgi:hypothetical protein